MKTTYLVLFLLCSSVVHGQEKKSNPMPFVNGQWIRDKGKNSETIFYEKDKYSWYLVERISGKIVEEARLHGENPVGFMNNRLTCTPFSEVSLPKDSRYLRGRIKKTYCFAPGANEPLELESFCTDKKLSEVILSLKLKSAEVLIECRK